MTDAFDLTAARAAIRASFPALVDQRLRPAGRGWDFAVYRVGDSLAARFPLHETAESLMAKELERLPAIAARVSLQTPAPLRPGLPSPDFPSGWVLSRWIPGDVAADAPLKPEGWREIVVFLRELHIPAPEEAPRNSFRGVPVAARSEKVSECLEKLGPGWGDLAPLWAAGCEATPARHRSWLHGDLHPGNIIVRGGRAVGVIDWGDLCGGDPATDVASLFMLFEGRQLEEALAAYGADPDLRARALAWAVFFGLVMAASHRADSRVLGRTIIERLRRLA